MIKNETKKYEVDIIIWFLEIFKKLHKTKV